MKPFWFSWYSQAKSELCRKLNPAFIYHDIVSYCFRLPLLKAVHDAGLVFFVAVLFLDDKLWHCYAKIPQRSHCNKYFHRDLILKKYCSTDFKPQSAATLSHILFLLPSPLLPLYPHRSVAVWGCVADIYGPSTALQCSNWPHNDANAQKRGAVYGSRKWCNAIRWQIFSLMNPGRNR